jgi:glycosyltransferase involved in cell wall biosynthesis
MKIALFDYKIISTNPIGGCHLRMLRGLSAEHDFTVFAAEFDNPDPERIEWVRIPAPVRPLALLFVTFHLLAPLYFALYKWRRRVSFDVVQGVETNLLFGRVAYSQFCHSAYLRDHAPKLALNVRDILRWLDHTLHAMLEQTRYRLVDQIVVPSEGLAREFRREFPFAANKLLVIPNPVDLNRLSRPPDCDPAAIRRELGFSSAGTVLAFAALGHFERKGLPLLLQAIANLKRRDLGLIVVGGETSTVDHYCRTAELLGIESQVKFVGLQRDFRRLLWASDAFAFPSAYETFSLVSFEAAAAGLALLTSRLYGVEDLLLDGVNGFELPRDAEGIAERLLKFQALTSDQRRAMGAISRERSENYSVERFVENWRAFYEAIGQSSCGAPLGVMRTA